MNDLRDLLEHFDNPVFSNEASDRWEEEERLRKHQERVKAARIPAEFLYADTSSCSRQVQDYVSGFTKETSTGLILRGEVGTGKTYTACAILNALLDAHFVRFATMGDILAEIRGTFNGSGCEEDVVSRWSNIRLLAIDDLGKEKPTEWVLSMMFRIIDNRWRNHKPTIFTTQYNGIQLANRLASGGEAETAEAIVSRLQTCKAEILSGKDRRIKLSD